MVSNISKFGKLKIALDTFGLKEDYTLDELQKAYYAKKKLKSKIFIKSAYDVLINNLNKKNHETKEENSKQTTHEITQDFDLDKLRTPEEIHANIMLKIVEELGADDKKIECLREYIKRELRNFDLDAISYFTNWNTYDAIVRYLNDPLFRKNLKPVNLLDAIDYFSNKENGYYDNEVKTKENNMTL